MYASAWTISIFLMKFTTDAKKLVCKTGNYASNIIIKPPPQKLLGGWCYNCSRLRGGQLENTRKTYLDLLNNLKFDDSDPIIGSCIFALICLFVCLFVCLLGNLI